MFRKIGCAILAGLGILGTGCTRSKWVWNTEEEYFRLPYYHQKVRQFDKVKLPPGTATLFIGDSITEGYDLQRSYGDNTIVNMGIGGDFTSGVLMRLESVKRLKPRKIFLMIGINDIMKNVPRAVIHERYTEIISSIRRMSPQTILYIQSNLPTSCGNELVSAEYVMNEVVALNTFLHGLCIQYGAHYIDLYPLFSLNGSIRTECTYDGLHVTEKGYTMWTAAIDPLVRN